MATLIIIIIYIIKFLYQDNLAGDYHLNIFSTSFIIIDLSIKKAKTLRKWNSMSEKKNDSLLENKMEELNFTSEEINDQVCVTTKMKQKKSLWKTKSRKERKCKIWFDNDWRRFSKTKTKQNKILNKRRWRWWPNTRWLKKKLLHKKIKMRKIKILLYIENSFLNIFYICFFFKIEFTFTFRF